MFNLSTLSGINLQTDNYFQYTSNTSSFDVRRTCVSFRMHLRFFKMYLRSAGAKINLVFLARFV